MKLQILTLTAGMLFSMICYSQQTLPDSINAHCDAIELDTLENSVEDLQIDSLKSTDESFYHNIWNSTQIKYPLNTLPPKDALVTVTLAQPYDHPFVVPVIGKVISKFGRRGRRQHTGTDIKLNSGDTVRCAFDGKVRLAKRFSGYGNLVLVRHSNGLETIYGHLKAIKVNVNDTIKAGDVIGLGGRTGRATCDHLHFETRLFGEPFDSNKYIDFTTCSLRSNHIYYKNKQFEIDQQNFNRKPVVADAPALAQKNETIEKINTGKPTESTEKVTPKAKPSKHVIRKGDNLGLIARKYHTSVQKLCALNNITAQKTLKIGTVLRLN